MIDFRIKIADKVIRFKSEDGAIAYNASDEREFKYFLYTGGKKDDLVLDIRYGMIPEFPDARTLFTVDGSWTLSRYKDKVLFQYPDRNLAGRFERVAEIDEDMTKGVIHVNREKTPEEARSVQGVVLKAGANTPQPGGDSPIGQATLVKAEAVKSTPEDLGRKVMTEIKANFFQAFLVEYIIRKKVGFLAHCSSVYYNGLLYLFMGRSQAGKSTIAGLWHDTAGTAVFNDDRAVLTVKNGALYFYNAPWVGALMEKCSLGEGDGAKIGGIFFIHQAKVNSVKRLTKTEGAANIFRNSFPVFWERGALNYVLDMCSDAAGIAPCYDLDFVNDESIITFLKDKLNKEER